MLEVNLSILCNYVTTYGADGWCPSQTMLSGTEESIVEWAKFIQKYHTVTVYHNGEHGIFDDVLYMDREQFEPGDVTLSIKSPVKAPNTWYLTNETNASELDLLEYEGVIIPSKWAFDNLGIQHPRVRILPHGYNSAEIYPGKKIKNQCLYASSPDRGLANLIEIWPKVVEKVPDATLIVTYGGEIDLPNVMCIGEVDNKVMNELYRTSDFWLHPCNGGELFCMTGIKAQVAQAIPAVYPVMALRETVRHGIKTTPTEYVKRLVDTMKSEEKKKDIRYKLRLENYPDWEQSGSMLMDIIGLKHG